MNLFTNEIIEKIDNEYDKMLQEKTDINAAKTNIESQLEREMKHMIKYTYQPSRQSKSWIETITGAVEEIESEYKYNDKQIKKFINDNIDKIYKNAVKEAKKDFAKDNYKTIISEEVPQNWNYENLTNDKFIKDFLVNNVESYNAKKYLNNKYDDIYLK